MKLLNTYDDRDEAEAAAEKLVGEKRLASERDATLVIYNLFGIPQLGKLPPAGDVQPGRVEATSGSTYCLATC